MHKILYMYQQYIYCTNLLELRVEILCSHLASAMDEFSSSVSPSLSAVRQLYRV